MIPTTTILIIKISMRAIAAIYCLRIPLFLAILPGTLGEKKMSCEVS
jgi:hypothetical protein